MSCCQIFDPIYANYLQKVKRTKSKKKLQNFEGLIKEWRGTLEANFLAKANNNSVKTKFDQIADNNSIFYFI